MSDALVRTDGLSFAAATVEKPLAGRRILIIVENLPVPFDRRVWQESNTLVNAGAQVVVICPTGKDFTAPYEIRDGVHIYRHKLPPEGNSGLGYLREYTAALWAELTLATKVWWKHGFDVIHACNPPDLIFLVALPFRIFGKKFIFDHHDINPELYEAKFNRRDFFWSLLKFFERLTFALADVSIATNNSYKQIAIERGKMAPDKVFVVRSGPDLSKFKAKPVDDSLRQGRTYMVGYVGVMGDQEGIDLLLDAVAELVKKRGRTDIQFCLCGSGPSRDALEVLAEKMGISDYVNFMGRVSDTTLMTVLSSADVCVNPDRVNPMNDKSTMNKIIEYMAMGKPIVQFDVAEGRYSAGDCSLYAKPNNAVDFATKIEDLLADPERRREMGEQGKIRVEAELSWKHQVPILISAYEAVFK
jgi:glycosyltransferase involved in cell wall biosynthesis